MSTINKTTMDFIDNREAMSNRKTPVTADIKKAGSTKGKTEIMLQDHNHTIIYCSKKKDPKEVEFIYRRHLGLDTAGFKAPKHMINGIEPEVEPIEEEDID